MKRVCAPIARCRAETASSRRAELGLSLGELDARVRARLGIDDDVEGVVVTRVQPDSQAALKGLAPGDVLVRVGQRPVSSVSEAASAIDEVRDSGRDAVVLQVVRNGAAQFVAIPFE